jgi:16S rRNA G527 N7-methylase RsmG
MTPRYLFEADVCFGRSFFYARSDFFFGKYTQLRKKWGGRFDKLYHWILTSGMWPAEEILTYFCVLHPDLFQKKRVIELGAGYGLAGLAIAACTEASEVLLTDGNPQVVDCILLM